jgi:VIT1/CCC1 family predicted Fe2+/Mn2+ transporter
VNSIEANASDARTVAKQLMAKDALKAHARDELGLTDALAARPLQAAMASAASFAIGAGVPVLTILLSPMSVLLVLVSMVTVVCLIGTGAIAARLGGASILFGAARVALWGVLALAATAGIGRLFGAAVG